MQIKFKLHTIFRGERVPFVTFACKRGKKITEIFSPAL